jgi:hypothetical protein
MPLYNPAAPLSIEAPSLDALAVRISETAAAQDLNRTPGDAAATLARIKICEPTDPWDTDTGKFTREQLDEELAFQIDLSPAEDAEFTAGVNVGDPEGRCPNMAGSIEARVLTQIRDAEFEEDGEKNCYLWHMDRVAALCEQLFLRVDEAAKGDPIIKRVRRLDKPLWNPTEKVEAQGRHIWSVLVVEYGSRFGDE